MSVLLDMRFGLSISYLVFFCTFLAFYEWFAVKFAVWTTWISIYYRETAWHVTDATNDFLKYCHCVCLVKHHFWFWWHDTELIHDILLKSVSSHSASHSGIMFKLVTAKYNTVYMYMFGCVRLFLLSHFHTKTLTSKTNHAVCKTDEVLIMFQWVVKHSST